MTPVIWTNQALADLERVRRRIARDRPRAAGRIVKRLFEAAERLAEYPLSGRIVPEKGQPTIRELVVERYRIIHLVEADRVTIWTVYHSSRLLKPKQLRQSP